MKKFGLDTEHLYIVSSLVLQDFVIMLRDKRSTSKTTRIIHEKVLITNLLDALAERKDRKYEGAHPDDD
jgi:hypothetical protein